MTPEQEYAQRWITARSCPEPNSGCWLWLGRTNVQTGYGQGYLHGATVYAHRISHEAFVGPIPDGLHIDHLCRNRACCNPDHLEAVTCLENVRRSPIHVGSRTHCPQGHEYGESRTARGFRACRTCHNEQAREQTRTQTAMQRAARASGVPLLSADDPRHGTSTAYKSYGCRCAPCKAARAAYTAARKARAAA